MKFPPPLTFEDGQRRLFGWLMAAAGVAYSISVLCGIAVVVWGEWPADLAKLRLYILAGALGFGCIGSVAVTLALAVGGPVGRFTAEGGRDGFKLGAESDRKVTTTVETKG